MTARPQADLKASSPSSLTRVRALVDSQFNFVWRYLRGLGVPEASVDDAAQQVFLVAAQKIDAIEEGRERSFLVGTAIGVAANARRSNARRREVSIHAPGPAPGRTTDHAADGADLLPADDAPNPEERTQSKQAIVVLDRFLESLPEDLRVVFILFELEGMTMAAIAESLGVPSGTVASRLRRAREEFHAMAKRFQAGLAREVRS
jgi:RNA polymerase sigma-70 factor (ECF subfamily)